MNGHVYIFAHSSVCVSLALLPEMITLWKWTFSPWLLRSSICAVGISPVSLLSLSEKMNARHIISTLMMWDTCGVSAALWISGPAGRGSPRWVGCFQKETRENSLFFLMPDYWRSSECDVRWDVSLHHRKWRPRSKETREKLLSSHSAQ